KGSGLFGESYGHAVASVGDVTGNGFDDVLVSDEKSEGSPSNNLSINRGTVYLYEGSASGLSLSPVWSYTETQLDSTATIGAKYGFALAAAGDVNQDGFNDFIVGANEYSSPTKNYVGRVYVYLGVKGGVSSTPFTIESEVGSGTNFGTSVAAADVNGDGRNDLIVGHPQFDNLLAAGLDEGRVLVYLANPATVFDPKFPQTLFTQTADWSYSATGNKAGFGTHVANAGDVDADGYDDIIVGSPGFSNGQALEGAAYIFYGGLGGISTTRQFWFIESDQIDALLGLRVAGVGDINGDSIADVMVSAIGWDAVAPSEGKAFLYLGVKKRPGVPGGPSTTKVTWTYLGGSESSNLNSIASAGDVNGDGFGDVIIGLQAYSNPETLEGRILLFEGTSTGLTATPTWGRESNVVSGQIGFSVAGGGDFNGDGYSDIIAGAPGVNTVGTAYAFYGAGDSDLAIVVTDSADPVFPSTNFTYALNITNYGPNPAHKVVVVNTLPATAIFKSVTADVNWVCNELMLEITCTTDTIAANAATSVIDIVLQFPTTASAITNVATISANIVDANVTNNTDNEVTQINTPPIATTQSINTDEDVKYTTTQPTQYLQGSDPDSDPISFSLNTQATNGVAAVQLNGGFNYQPNPDFNGSDAFSFSVSDGINKVSATVNITVNAVNDAPVANNSAINVLEDTVYSLGVLTASDIDTPSTQLSYSLNQIPQQGAVVIQLDGTYTYTPKANYNGNDSFRFTVSDNAVPKLTSTGTVSITVLVANDPPNVAPMSFSTQEDTPLNGQLQATDDITPANALTYREVVNAGPNKGSVDISLNGSFIYTPLLNKIGTDSFDFEVTDTGNPALSSISTVNITINNINDAPIAVALVVPPFDEDTPATGQVLATDPETPAAQLLFSVLVSPEQGKVVMQNDGQFEYTPSKDFSGLDSFVFKVEDDSVPRSTASATVSLTISAVNDSPVARNGNINIIQNQAWGAFLLGDDVEK
ncbi:MAG: tandem-95 repeat protein, partial [Thiohalomonadales bacterium]